MNFLRQRLSYPGMGEAELQRRISYWFTNLGISMFVAAMTILAASLQVKSLVLFGCLLLAIYVPSMLVHLVFTFRRSWLIHLGHHLQLVVTFYIIVRLGGLHNSGGIILAGLAMVITSISFNRNLWSIWYFSFFFLGILTVAIIQFKMQLTAEMPSHVNHLFFLINTLCISAYSLVIVLVYLGQFTKIEKDKADRLRELDEFKSKLYTNITHEFRTPLTVILGMSDQIEADPDKGLKKGLDKIRENSQNLLHLVNQMLDLARLEAGAMPAKMIQGDIIAFLRFLTESFQSMAQDQQIHLSFEPAESYYMMDFDPEKLKQIVSNLLSNAIKYNRAGGEVRIIVHMDYNRDPKLKIAVHDNGIGIPGERLDHIFDRFYRIEDDAHKQLGGTGLGLSITREMVRLLKGEIRVESVLYQGTSFLVELPVTREAKPALFPEDQEMATSLKKNEDPDALFLESESVREDLPILLIVEDNRDVSDYLRSFLENEYRVESAENGQQGLHKAWELVPDIILSDVMMPEMDGIEMLSRLKKDMRSSHIPVIMLTAKADIASRLKGFETGAEAYLEKPFNKDELIVRLKKLVELRKELRERYTSYRVPDSLQEEELIMEDQFMQKLHNAFDANLDDENFGIGKLCHIMAMSRAQLYRKFKALTDRTIMDYLLSFRLHRAKELLENPGLNVSQVAYMVGFKNLSHFSSRFTEEHGYNPSEVKHPGS